MLKHLLLGANWLGAIKEECAAMKLTWQWVGKGNEGSRRDVRLKLTDICLYNFHVSPSAPIHLSPRNVAEWTADVHYINLFKLCEIKVFRHHLDIFSSATSKIDPYQIGTTFQLVHLIRTSPEKPFSPMEKPCSKVIICKTEWSVHVQTFHTNRGQEFTSRLCESKLANKGEILKVSFSQSRRYHFSFFFFFWI